MESTSHLCIRIKIQTLNNYYASECENTNKCHSGQE